MAVASIGRLRAYRAFGFPRLRPANELTDAAGASPGWPASWMFF